VDPVTATLPVDPGSVQPGVPPFSGAAVGHALAAVAVSVTEDAITSATEGVLADEVSVSEPHAASVMTSHAAQATSATEGDTREEFTVVTLQPHYAVLPVALRCRRWVHLMKTQYFTGNAAYSIRAYSPLWVVQSRSRSRGHRCLSMRRHPRRPGCTVEVDPPGRRPGQNRCP